jgi:hypothetical protein
MRDGRVAPATIKPKPCLSGRNYGHVVYEALKGGSVIAMTDPVIGYVAIQELPEIAPADILASRVFQIAEENHNADAA